MEQRLYSPEPVNNLMSQSTGNNGTILQSVNFNRHNRQSTVYIEIKTDKRLIPKVSRAYYDESGSLRGKSKTYAIIEPTDDYIHLEFDYDEHNDFAFVSYKVSFECLSDDTTIDVAQIGVTFDIDLITSTLMSYKTSLLTDVNNIPLYKQNYINTYDCSFICNQTDKEEVLNIVEKPYYLVNILNNCIDNSTKLLVENGITVDYVTSATKLVEITIKNIVGK